MVDSKKEALRRIREIRSAAGRLKDVLWSQEELAANKDVLNAASQKINDTVDLIAKNFYWYQKIGWKRFLSHRENVEERESETKMEEEKRRFFLWLKASETGMDFYRNFPRRIPENLVFETQAAGKQRQTQDSGIKVLDVCCRDGFWLQKSIASENPALAAQPQFLAGVEPVAELAAKAQAALGPKAEVVQGYPDSLPFPDRRFDVIYILGFLAHVLDKNLQRKLARECLRVLSECGTLVIVNPAQAWLVNLEPYIAYTVQIPTEERLHHLFPDCRTHLQQADHFTFVTVARNTQAPEEK